MRRLQHSPALGWTTPPERIQSFVLIMDDPDAPGRTWVHWVLYDLPATDRELPEGVLHLRADATRAQIEGSIRGHVLAHAELMGQYRRKA